MLENIRNFVVISHVDHGKSTLADRFLEITKTVDPRKMKEQYLDQLELERERGITIKMAPVRMVYRLPSTNNESIANKRAAETKFINSEKDYLFFNDYILNLIDTPGHSDFSYEVSRALAAVEGAILLVDATKGIQAQTLANFRAAKEAGLTIIGAVNKIDLKPSHLEKTVDALAELLGVSRERIFRVSGKTGEGVEDLLRAVIERVPPPSIRLSPPIDRPESASLARMLIFDSLYDDHKGIIAYVRVFEGEFNDKDDISFFATGAKCRIKELGFFSPDFKASAKISAGEIGYIATGFKEPELVKTGDTIIKSEIQDSKLGTRPAPLSGYREPTPVVFISFYPDGATDFEDLKRGLERLRLTDAALSFEPDNNEALGRGLKVGFLGQLHFEIAASRLKDEFNLEFLTSFPSIAYKVKEGGKFRVVKDAHDFPEKPEEVFEPIIEVEIIAPSAYLSQVVGLKNKFELEVREIKNIGENVLIVGDMPLRELIRDFDDSLKSVSAGYASFSYRIKGEASAEVEKMEILVAGEVVSALTRIVPKKDLEKEGRLTAERLKELLPRKQFAQSIQARALGRIIAREDIPAMRKDVTGYLYGGDRTRKMKLWKKQKRGKEKLKRLARVNLPPEVFREILKK